MYNSCHILKLLTFYHIIYVFSCFEIQLKKLKNQVEFEKKSSKILAQCRMILGGMYIKKIKIYD
jgi:hypothetical protein